MEKVLSGDEKIRRAEEIYYRRKMGLPNNSKVLENDKKSYLGAKILLELLVILNLSIIIVAIQNKDFIFTKEFLNKISDYNMNLTTSIKAIINDESEIDTNSVNEIDNILENSVLNNVENNVSIESQNILKVEAAIVPNENQVSSLSQMDLDVEEMKKSCSFEKPIEGTVTSIFGARESKYQNVRGYHTGIDIGAKTGTIIKAVHPGKVILVSSKGDYGKHIKIENNGIESLYAHCSKILVKEGDNIDSGQEIAKVGSTGNSTGPHLHYEIKFSNRLVDPSRLINF